MLYIIYLDNDVTPDLISNAAEPLNETKNQLNQSSAVSPSPSTSFNHNTRLLRQRACSSYITINSIDNGYQKLSWIENDNSDGIRNMVDVQETTWIDYYKNGGGYCLNCNNIQYNKNMLKDTNYDIGEICRISSVNTGINLKSNCTCSYKLQPFLNNDHNNHHINLFPYCNNKINRAPRSAPHITFMQ